MKKLKVLLRTLLVTAIMISTPSIADAQLHNLGGKIRKAKNDIERAENKIDKAQKGENTPAANKVRAVAANTAGKTYYVCAETGSARGDGSLEKPVRDIQRAIDLAADGDLVKIAQGNYLGNLDRGWIEIKGKYVSLEGGWNNDFTERDPLKYVTRIQPGVDQRGTVGSGILRIEATKDIAFKMCIDGIFFDLGNLLEYCIADPTDPRWGCPEGCETGRVKPVGNPPNPTVRLIGGKFKGDLTIRNCMFTNASFNAIIMTSMGGNWEIYNNVFVSNLYAACEITGGLNQQQYAHKSKVNFHHNTVMFSWPTTKEMESMGYGYRLRNGADHDVHHNIFGCNNFGAIDAGWDDSNLPERDRKICSAYDNRFFMNKGDIVVAGTSGGKWIYVPAKRFDEVMLLTEYERNEEIASDSNFKDVIDPAYLKGYASLEIMTSTSYDANSAANLYREANGLNKQGTMTTRVSMFGNRYNFDKAMKFFGAVEGYGAQLPVMD